MAGKKELFYEVRDRNGVVLMSTYSKDKAEKYMNNYELDEGEGIKLVEVVETTIRGAFRMK